MDLTTIVISIGIGLGAGIFYGFSFLPQLFPLTRSSRSSSELRKRTFFSFFLFSTLRIGLIGALWFYILRTRPVNIILVLISFFISFWYIILRKRAKRYGKH